MKWPELFATVLELSTGVGTPAIHAGGYQAYSLVLRLIASADPELANTIHQTDDAKPLTVGPPIIRGNRASGGKTVSIRITTLQPVIYDAIARAVVESVDRQLELAGFAVRVARLTSGAQTQGMTACATYRELVQPVDTDGHQKIVFRFETPATFRSSGVNATFPISSLVFGSLGRRWNVFAPSRVPDGALADLGQSLIPTAYNLRTRQVDFGAYKQIGVVGSCAYQALKGMSQESLLWGHILARFATYAGIGAKTTMGMGQAWEKSQPRRP